MVKKIAQIIKDQVRNIILLGSMIIFLVILLNQSYLLFHVFIELFSIVIAFSLFIVTWNSRKVLDNQYLFFIGIVALFIGILDTFHTVTYQGMNIIKSQNFYANQFWIATRLLESFAMLTGFLFLKRKTKIHPDVLLTGLSILTGILILSILYWKIFPVCFIKDIGQTKFKIDSEYVIILVLIISLALLIKNRRSFDSYVFRLLLSSIIFAIITEFCFTLYSSNFGFSNQLGHFTKLLTFYLIYKAIVETGFVKPTETIFKNLKDSEARFHAQSIELAELNATKDKFFSIIAHDLKNPFNSLVGFSELLYENALNYTPEKVQQFASAMRIASKQGYKLLENLLEWSRLQTGRIKPRPVKLKPSELIKEVILLEEQMSQSKNIDLQSIINCDDFIFADVEMIKTVLRNLISNAIKFTNTGGIVKIETKKHENSFLFEVSDTGVGIQPEHIDKLFGIDSKLSEPGTAGERGTGLGLILCKEFVEKHDGKIWVESELKKGSNFKFILPLYSD